MSNWEMALLALDVSLACVAVAIWSVRRKVHKFHNNENTPAYLGLVRTIEATYRSKRPAVVAKTDRVYRNGRQITVCETKSRPGRFVMPRDIVQLSAQRVCVKNHNIITRLWFKYPLIGYVRCVHPETGSITWVDVELMSDRALKSIYRRYQAIQKKPKIAIPTTKPKDCKKCGVRYACDHSLI